MLALRLIPPKTKEMVIGGCQIRTVQRVRENSLPHVLIFFFQGQMSSVMPSIIVLQGDLSYGTFIAQCMTRLECRLYAVSVATPH